MTFTDMTDLYRSLGKTKKCTFIFCADHGVEKMGVSAYPQSTTADMVKNYLVDKGAAANVFANFCRSELVVVDVGVNADISNLPGLVDRKIAFGTGNIAEGPAMTRAQARRSIKIGRDLVKKAVKAGCNCFLIGEMGIANTTVASAITAAILEVNPKKVTGRGSNISDKRFKNKLKVVRKALKVNDTILSRTTEWSHPYAIEAYSRYTLYERLGEERECLVWLVRSAIADVRCGITDNGSSWLVARECFEVGDLERAYHFSDYSLTNASFFNAPTRFIQTYALGHEISGTYEHRLHNYYIRLIIALVALAVALIVMVVGVMFAWRQNRRLHALNKEMQAMNAQLRSINHQLKEADKVVRPFYYNVLHVG